MKDSFERISAKKAADTTTPAQIGAIILLGAPGVGKGTQGRELSRVWGIPHISTGELLRTNMEKGTFLGRAAKAIMNRGDLVPDSLMKELIEVRLLDADTALGYILDGFPRTLDQAIWLTESIRWFRKELRILPISIHMNREQLVRRISGRRNCPRCQATFNIYENPPKKDGLCDRDNNALIQRPDDTEKTLNRRLELYDRLTAPVIEHFQKRGQFVEVSGDGPIEWITERILGTFHLIAYEAHVRESPTLADEDQPKLA